MRVQVFLCVVGLAASMFFACGRSDLEDDYFGFSGFDGGGVGATTSGGSAGITGGNGGVLTGGSGGLVTGGGGGIVAGGTGGLTGGEGGIGTGGSGGGAGGIVTGGTSGVGGGVIVDGGNFFDSFPFPDSGPIADCVACADENCNDEVNGCFNSSTCAQGVVCAATSCGGFNLQCILQCFGGNFQMALQAFEAFSCLSQNCGQDCIGVITGGGRGSGGPTSPSNTSEHLTPRAGGWYGAVTAEQSEATGLPKGNVYVPSIEVLNALQSSALAH